MMGNLRTKSLGERRFSYTHTHTHTHTKRNESVAVTREDRRRVVRRVAFGKEHLAMCCEVTQQ